MAEYIDMLTTAINEGAQFVVNTGVNSVDLTEIPVVNKTLYASGGRSVFHSGDSFVVLSCGYILPHYFEMAGYESANVGVVKAAVPIITLQWTNHPVSTFIGLLTQMGNDGSIRIPLANYEMSIGVFVGGNTMVDPGVPGSYPDFQLLINFPGQGAGGVDQPQVSMIGAPASLNGETLYAVPFVKVLHNLPLIA